jgi:hypothetical protein
MGEKRKTYAGFWWENLKETHLEHQGVDGRIELKCI